MPGRLRTASSPRSTLMDSASYCFSGELPLGDSVSSVICATASVMAAARGPPPGELSGRDPGVAHVEELGIAGHAIEKGGIGTREPGLQPQQAQLLEQRLPAHLVQMGHHLVQQEER